MAVPDTAPPPEPATLPTSPTLVTNGAVTSPADVNLWSGGAAGSPGGGGGLAAPQTGSGAEAGRATWSGKCEFLLAAVGYAVGLGNVWRFPHLCYANGGGAFLIPYLLMMTFLGLPLFFLELCLGQYASLGPITIWRCFPLLKGLGYAMTTIALVVSLYYNVIIAYTILYFFASFTSELPWATCGHWWNTANCSENRFDSLDGGAGGETSTHLPFLMTTLNTSLHNFTVTGTASSASVSADFTHISNSLHSTVATILSDNSSGVDNNNATYGYHFKSPAAEYWERYVLGLQPDTNLGNLGGSRWHVTLCLLLAWIVVFLCIYKGIKSIGKVVYFTALFPYFILFVLFFRGLTLDGAIGGLKYYLKPDFSRMSDVKVWNDAAVQILYSLGPGFGTLLTMGSYNKFHNNCHCDALVVTLINCGTSVFAGFVIFSVIGHMSYKAGVSVDQVVDKGPGLAFVVYPEGLAMMPGAPFWSICFFFMLFLLGLDSQFAGMECVVTAVVDEFPRLFKYKTYVAAVTCALLFFLGLPCTTQGGMYVIELLDKFSTNIPLLIIVLMELLVVCWGYGFRRFVKDITLMLGFRPNYFWLVCWLGISPLVTGFILVFSCVEYTGLVYKGYEYPAWAEGVGWLLSLSAILMIPGWAVVKVAAKIGSWERLLWVVRGRGPWHTLGLGELVRPDPAWGPALVEHRQKQHYHHSRLQEDDGPEDRAPKVLFKENTCVISGLNEPGANGASGDSYI